MFKTTSLVFSPLLWLAATPAQAESTLDKYLKKNTESTSASSSGKDDGSINKVFKSAEGHWRLDDTRSSGGFCAVTYVSGPYTVGYIGASVQGPQSYIVFSGPTIPPISKEKRKKMKFAAASTKQLSEVYAFHRPNRPDSGAIMFALTDIKSAIDLMSDTENLALEMEKKQVFDLKWKGGHTARKAMQGCISSGTEKAVAK